MSILQNFGGIYPGKHGYGKVEKHHIGLELDRFAQGVPTVCCLAADKAVAGFALDKIPENSAYGR